LTELFGIAHFYSPSVSSVFLFLYQLWDFVDAARVPRVALAKALDDEPGSIKETMNA
jgi:hypothetical protein